MKKAKYCSMVLGLFVSSLALAQTPPENPFLVDSPFPMVHMNSYRQASTELRGPEPGDSIVVRTTSTPNDKVSPWLMFSAKYNNGERAIWGSHSTHVYKAVSNNDRFEVVGEYQVDDDAADLNWNFLFVDENTIVTRDETRLLKIADVDPNDINSDIDLIDVWEAPDEIGLVGKMTTTFDNRIAFTGTEGYFCIIDEDFTNLDLFRIPVDESQNEAIFQNDYAYDEKGNYYFSTTLRMICINWNGSEWAIQWEVPLNFGGNFTQGIGTTPTLMGTDGDDKIVSVVNSNSPAEMLTFWREEIPDDWQGLDGFPRRVAAITPLTYAAPINGFFSAVENSPCAWGYEICAAQYNGFLPQSCDTSNGVQKLRWNTASNTMEIVWATDEVNMNNVMTYSNGSGLVYGSGRENDCNYYYYGLDWETGEVRLRILMGDDRAFDDPGNANIINEDRSITFNSLGGLTQIQVIGGNQGEDEDDNDEEDGESDDMADEDPGEDDEVDNSGDDDIEADIVVFNAVSKNPDGLNDFFRIDGIESFPDNTLSIFDRTGNLVYKTQGYGIDNNWFYGQSNTTGGELSGTYYYVLTYQNTNTSQQKSGYLYVQ